jgi:peptide-methionine (S)-S-oxide reductase
LYQFLLVELRGEEQVNAIATFGGGCFWCLDAAFRQLRGVEKVVSGYAGGKRPNPSYEQVCSGATGHAEVIQISYDPNIISYRDLLGVLFTIHDPTTLNRQGSDTGTQYRSVILYHSPDQEQDAKDVIAELEREHVWSDRIVTELTPYSVFYPAEGYHQDYFNKNPNQPYCSAVVAPKVSKIRKAYFDRLVKA